MKQRDEYVTDGDIYLHCAIAWTFIALALGAMLAEVKVAMAVLFAFGIIIQLIYIGLFLRERRREESVETGER